MPRVVAEERDLRHEAEATLLAPQELGPLALGSLGIAIPLMGIAGGIAKLPGIIAVCVAIVLVDLLWVTRR